MEFICVIGGGMICGAGIGRMMIDAIHGRREPRWLNLCLALSGTAIMAAGFVLVVHVLANMPPRYS